MNKFQIGDEVHCYREEDDYNSGFDFYGAVVKFRQTEINEWEYEVSNAPHVVPGFPILIWESEMK